jgi:hypothetical protein
MQTFMYVYVIGKVLYVLASLLLVLVYAGCTVIDIQYWARLKN